MEITREATAEHGVRADESMQAELWAGLWKEGTIRSLDLGSVSVSVQNGSVLLEGHVARGQNRLLIEEVAWSVPGVITVHNRLISDRHLTIQVAQALAHDERTRHLLLRTGSYHGWVSLSGEVATHEARRAAEEVAGSVPPVRGVVALPRVAGEGAAPRRRAVQPQIGAGVYGNNGQFGIVSEVIISPRNRLVSHVVVSADYEVGGWPVFGEYVLPVEALAQVTVESIFLARNGLPLSAYPRFDAAEYPVAPVTWQPPYPYAPGAVRWPRQEIWQAKGRRFTHQEVNLAPVQRRIQVDLPLDEAALSAG